MADSKENYKLDLGSERVEGTWIKLITIITIKLTIIIILMIILERTIIQLIIMTISIIIIIIIIMTIIMISFCCTEIKIFGDWLIVSFSLRAKNRSFLQGVQTCTY